MFARYAPVAAIALGLLLGQASYATDATDAAGGPGHITGLGGVFVKSRNPAALAKWYRETLGLKLEPWGGAKLSYEAPQHPAEAVWMPLAETDAYMAPSTRDIMLDFAVDDLDAFLARLTAKGVKILKRDDQDPNGKFAWIVDPDGTKIELRQSKQH